jgi:hypothetical protein
MSIAYVGYVADAATRTRTNSHYRPLIDELRKYTVEEHGQQQGPQGACT